MRFSRRHLSLFALGFGLTVVKGVCAAETPKGDPKSLGRVAILPFLDLSGERQEDRGEFRETALAEVEERMRKYEIQYVTREEMTRALASLKIVPTDEEDRTKAKLQLLADHLKSRYVVTGTIIDAKSEFRRNNGFQPPKANQAKVQFRVYDAVSQRYAEDMEDVATSTARGNAFQRSNKLRVKAVRDATKKSMERLLKPFPKVHEDDPDD